MMTPMSEDGGILREWSPLSYLLQQIPIKFQNGIFTQDINLTCIAALPEFLAIGTNCGLIYWYNRDNGDIERLKCENINSSITCLSVISTVDYMIAAGSNNGTVTVFQIPKNLPESLPECLKSKHKKQIERYNIGGLHKNKVTSVEWSKNGMKLFSGDRDGLVVLTEIDFYMHLSKSCELLNEKYSVVQLSYQQGYLLISTLFRTIIVDRNKNNKVSQIGQKERKTLGKLGAVFAPRLTPTQEPIIYASRPGKRLWLADKTGTVSKTLIFKELIQTDNTKVNLLNPAPDSFKLKRGEPTFGIILPFNDHHFITYSQDIIYIINPITITITCIINDIRKITNLTCTKDEIFIIEGERNIIRIGYYPEKLTIQTTEQTKETLSSFVEISKPVTQSIINLTSKILISNPPSSGGIDPNPIFNAEEATEMPPIVPLTIDKSLITQSNQYRKQIFDKIGQQEFEDVVFTPEKKICKKVITNQQFNSSYDDDDDDDDDDTDSIFKINRNLETIQKDVENKEKLLANVLNFDLSEYMRSNSDTNANQSLDTITYLNCTEPTINNEIDENQDEEDDLSYNTEFKKIQNLGECSKFLENDVLHSRELEIQFNELSKEFVSSVIVDEADDWVVIE